MEQAGRESSLLRATRPRYAVDASPVHVGALAVIHRKGPTLRNSLRRAATTVLGFVLVIAGIAALVLPGPGLLLLLAGLVLLSQEFEWAQRRVEPVKQKAFDVAKAGVETVPRIVLSTLGALALLAVGVVWIVNPTIPEIGPFGPDLPAGGWATGSSIALSGLVALGLVVYSVKRFRVDDDEGRFRPPATPPRVAS